VHLTIKTHPANSGLNKEQMDKMANLYYNWKKGKIGLQEASYIKEDQKLRFEYTAQCKLDYLRKSDK